MLRASMAEGTQESVNRLPKLNEPTDYIQWRRRVHAYLRRDDPHLIGLSPHPHSTPSINENWLKNSTKAKSNIILSLGDSALALTRLVVDSDEKCAQDLWLELQRIYTTSNEQSIQNLKNKLDALIFKEDGNWDKHVNS